MYETFGAKVDRATKTVEFRLFVPDGDRVPTQYEGGGLPRLTGVFVVGSFQDPATRAWDLDAPVRMTAADYIDPATGTLKGVLYTASTEPLPDGFYEYKYRVDFENAPSRYIG